MISIVVVLAVEVVVDAADLDSCLMEVLRIGEDDEKTGTGWLDKRRAFLSRSFLSKACFFF